jgi:Lysyl oxidase
MRARVPTLAAAVALSLTALTAGQAAAAPGGLQLPNLEQEPPSDLVLTSGALDGRPDRYYLGFRSAVRNVGDGPLIISGRRAGRRTPTMVATQRIQGPGGVTQRVRGVGRMRYVVSPTHRHWHLLTFDRYTLRRIGGARVVRRDRKTGFCLGDRFRSAVPSSGPSPAGPAYTSNCGLLQPGRLRVTEGISVGYGDDYAANLEGQYIGLRGLPAGDYVLTHEVNPTHRLRELDYADNAASLRLHLRWAGGKPVVRVLASCEHSALCTKARTPRRRVAGASVAFAAAAPRLYCHLRPPG